MTATEAPPVAVPISYRDFLFQIFSDVLGMTTEQFEHDQRCKPLVEAISKGHGVEGSMDIGVLRFSIHERSVLISARRVGDELVSHASFLEHHANWHTLGIVALYDRRFEDTQKEFLARCDCGRIVSSYRFDGQCRH
jgi:hypothetical protein